MLEILSETKDPTRVQPHLKKCFEGIDVLRFMPNEDITGMISAEGELIPLKTTIMPGAANGAVEKWLLQARAAPQLLQLLHTCSFGRLLPKPFISMRTMRDFVMSTSSTIELLLSRQSPDAICTLNLVQVEQGMVESLHSVTRQGVEAYPTVPRTKWVLEWPGQIVLVITAIYWTQDVTESIAAGVQGSLQACAGAPSRRLLFDLVSFVREVPIGLAASLTAFCPAGTQRHSVDAHA